MAGEERSAGWIPSSEYDLIQAQVPIACVDLLSLDADTGALGLIRRRTYEGGEGWCLIGGAIQRNETLEEAIARHVRSSVGTRFSYRLCSSQPLLVAEYFPDPAIGELHDPRKHAVALSYAATCTGEPRARGEAMEFRWFERDELQGVAFGFGQGAVVERLLNKLDE